MSETDETTYVIGQHFGKLDLDRTGFFDDATQGPGPFGSYDDPVNGSLRTNFAKGPQMFSEMHGRLFEKGFKRIFQGEALADEEKNQKKKKKESKGILIRPPFPKKNATPGDWFGCIGKQPKAFSPETIEQSKPPKMPPNFSTNPSKVGGPGYKDICINPYLPIYGDYEPYEPEIKRSKASAVQVKDRYKTTIPPSTYFDENPFKPLEPVVLIPDQPKRVGKFAAKIPKSRRFYLTFPQAPKGPKSGCFNRYPSWISDPYQITKEAKKKKIVILKIWQPVYDGAKKTKYTESIIKRVTDVACNATNYAEYREQVYKLD
ncbi:UPF0602 protein C4orf47 homolog [Trichogramma pretiosum]|uniref:UPF0602 protein C4orf47 homolog n=1 Tax=Trichogramma pretiosum TaxID=7493 RepID=UPI0006C9A9E0|nr:UPF0602 protein C4orf47 homolog [Trichogramma pretiosum]XP_023317786.1 UPF0602 protein C4orf47 homolog [Trichogramma pretiosum]